MHTNYWIIYQVFHLLKKQSLDLTQSLAHKYETLSRLAVAGLLACVRVLQLFNMQVTKMVDEDISGKVDID